MSVKSRSHECRILTCAFSCLRMASYPALKSLSQNTMYFIQLKGAVSLSVTTITVPSSCGIRRPRKMMRSTSATAKPVWASTAITPAIYRETAAASQPPDSCTASSTAASALLPCMARSQAGISTVLCTVITQNGRTSESREITRSITLLKR